jgi:uncharacterized protein (TIRG00374 family)
VGLPLAFVAWSAECVGFWLVLQGVGLPGTPLLLVQAGFIYAAATLGGALVTPGGLGVAEGGIVALGQLLLGLERGPAAAAALLIRVATLWFAVALGLAALLLATTFGRRLTGQRPVPYTPTTTDEGATP